MNNFSATYNMSIFVLSFMLSVIGIATIFADNQEYRMVSMIWGGFMVIGLSVLHIGGSLL